MIEYNEMDLYDTELKKARFYGSHEWALLPNSKGILVVKCFKCNISRLYLIGQDMLKCKGNLNG